MKYSFIVPIYNVEKYLSQCVDSILAQTYIDYEIILVDDGSKDNSGKICDELAKKSNKIIVIHKENGGLSSARNAGMDIAKGKYVIFIDSDDYFCDDHFLEKVDEKTKNNFDLLFFKFKKEFEDTGKISECTFAYPKEYDKDNLLYKMIVNDAYYGTAWCKVVKKECMDKANIRFEFGLLSEDIDWCFTLMNNIENIDVLDEASIVYRQREGSISKSLKIKNLTDNLYIIDKWGNYYKSHNENKYQKEMLGALAKYYANLLIVYSRVKEKEKKNYKKQLKSFSFLLNYALNDRAIKIRKIYKIFGFNITVSAISLLDRIKKNGK